MSIPVLCTGSSARSILLERILTHRSNGRIKAYSAGSKPAAVSVEDQPGAFETAYGLLDERATVFLDAPIKQMSTELLRATLNKIGG